MSGNPKQPAAGGPQTQRFQNSPYQPISAANSFSVIGTDAFPVTTPPGSYVPQGQGPNQGPGLRGIAPAAPPNQASTPPNTDIKVQALQTNPMSQMYVQSPQVRTQQGAYYTRTAPPGQSQRMPNQQRQQQQIYPPQYMLQAPYHFMPSPMPGLYAAQRPNSYVQPAIQQVYAPPLPSFQSYPNPSQQPQYYYNNMLAARGPVPQAAATAQNPTAQAPLQAGVPPMVAAQTQPPPSQHSAFPAPGAAATATKPRLYQRTRRENAIPIIDPDTGLDKLNEIYDEAGNSHPPSGESSASQTPQPEQHVPDKEVQATFAKQVAQVAQDANRIEEVTSHEVSSQEDHTEIFQQPSPTQPAVHNANFENIAHSSNLQINAKEFVSSSKPQTTKETPIVSANSDAAEFILPNKAAKDKDSPARNRKQQRDQTPKEDPPKQTWTASSEKIDKNTTAPKEEKQQDLNANVPAQPVPTVVMQPQLPVATKESGKENISGEKKKGKVANGSESRSNNEQPPAIPSTPTVQQPPTTATELSQNNTAKSKQNAQKSNKQAAAVATAAAATVAPQNNAKLQPPIAVPVPQPAKPNNRTTKKSELNLKGASKEGTDMDAFNDNSLQKEEVNANIKMTNQNDIINANSIPTPTPPVTTNTTVMEVNESTEPNLPESNETNVTIKPEVKIKSKEGFDVTSIIKDVHKPVTLKPFTAPARAENQDETVTQTDNAVLVNNVSNKNNSSGESVNDKLKYPDGQWAPFRPQGLKVYGKEFLMALSEAKESKKKPPNLPDIVLADDRSRISDVRLTLGGGRTDFINPPFPNYGSKSNSQRGVMPTKRNSQGKLGPSGGGGGGKSSKPIPKVSISLREDVKLHETENAWKPARFVKSADMSDEDKKTEVLYRTVRSVLNKLTPQKFKSLLAQVKELNIDSKERLQGVIDLIFDKSVEEPNFSAEYANLCKELQLMQVTVKDGDEEKKCSFRTLLVTRCQSEFEKNSADETIRNKKLQDIEECTDPERKKELTFELEEYDRRLRRRSVGIIRFIGELFRQGMLTVNIMRRCLQTLLENRDEESLECLCKLMTTVGKDLVDKRADLSAFFVEMKNLLRTKISSRIRFMLQDVIDLKDSNWVPRRQDSNPKTIDQIQREAEKEMLNIQAMNSGPMAPRRDDRGGGGSDRKGRRNMSEDGWMDVAPKNTRTPFSVQSDKLKNKVPLADEPLGSSTLFGNWGKGSTFKTQPQPLVSGSNFYAALEHEPADKRPLSSRGRGPYSSKGPSLERNYNKFSDGRGSRSGSQHRPSDNASSQRGGPPIAAPSNATVPAPRPVQPEATLTGPAPEESKDLRTAAALRLTEEQIQRRVGNALDEYITDSCTAEEYFQEIVSTVSPDYMVTVVEDSFLKVLEKSDSARLKTGQLFSQLVKSGKLSLNNFCQGMENILAQAEDLKIDLPMIWDYYAQNLVDIVCNEVLPIDRLHKMFKILIDQGDAARVLAPLFKLVISEKGPNFLQSIWQKSSVHLGDFMPGNQVTTFIKNNNLEFLSGGDSPVGQTQLSWEHVQNKLSEFLRNKASFDDIVKWTSANVGDRIGDNKFIRALATAIFENSINKNKLNTEALSEHYKFLVKYVDNNSNYELQCLYALQALIHKMEHPQGLLLSICEKLYDDGTFSQESFIAWEDSKDPAEQEGKGVALKQLTSLFTHMKENDEEDYGTSSDEA